MNTNLSQAKLYKTHTDRYVGIACNLKNHFFCTRVTELACTDIPFSLKSTIYFACFAFCFFIEA